MLGTNVLVPWDTFSSLTVGGGTLYLTPVFMLHIAWDIDLIKYSSRMNS